MFVYKQIKNFQIGLNKKQFQKKKKKFKKKKLKKKKKKNSQEKKMSKKKLFQSENENCSNALGFRTLVYYPLI